MGFLDELFGLFSDGKTPQDVLEDEKRQLMMCTYENTPEHNFNGQKFWAKCVRVYDGDTIHIAFFIEHKPYRFRARLAGIDTAELRSPYENKEGEHFKELEEEFALKTKGFMESMILNRLVYVKCINNQNDKYGRLLVELYDTENTCAESYNETLVNNGFAYLYDGKSPRKLFKEWFYGVKDDTPSKVDNINDSEVLDHINKTNYII